jgi:2-keto-3-deoxy-6-phosphogluconate aldolase
VATPTEAFAALRAAPTRCSLREISSPKVVKAIRVVLPGHRLLPFGGITMKPYLDAGRSRSVGTLYKPGLRRDPAARTGAVAAWSRLRQGEPQPA